MLQLYYPVIPLDHIEEAIDKMLWFYRCGKDEEKEEDDKNKRYKRKEDKSPAYSFNEDGAYIYAAFKEQYDMDLSSEEPLHWWRFIALFESLGENTKISQIMFYRKVKVNDMPKEKRVFYNEMKKIYALKGSGRKKVSLDERNKTWKKHVQDRINEIESNKGNASYSMLLAPL